MIKEIEVVEDGWVRDTKYEMRCINCRSLFRVWRSATHIELVQEPKPGGWWYKSTVACPCCTLEHVLHASTLRVEAKWCREAAPKVKYYKGAAGVALCTSVRDMPKLFWENKKRQHSYDVNLAFADTYEHVYHYGYSYTY